MSIEEDLKRKYIYGRDGCCLRCGRKDYLTIDHILPVSRGGTWDVYNLQTLCGPCNVWKGSKHISYIGTKPDQNLMLPLPKGKEYPCIKVVGKIDLSIIKDRKKKKRA